MKILRNWIRLVITITAIIALISSLAGAQQQPDKVQLARKYMTMRGRVVMFAFKVTHEQADVKGYASLIAESFLQGLNRGPDWNRDNPEWKRVGALIERDIPNLVAELTEPYKQGVNEEIEKVFVNGLASHLSTEELGELIMYYSSLHGEELTKTQEELDDALRSGQAAFSKMMAKGQKVPPPASQDKKELQELMGLLDDYVLLQVAYLDPGPGKDRSGLQALPMITYSAVASDPKRYTRLWEKIPEQDRASIFAWRNSPLAMKERGVLMECANGVKGVIDPEKLAVQLTKIGEKYDKKWHALVQNQTEGRQHDTVIKEGRSQPDMNDRNNRPEEESDAEVVRVIFTPTVDSKNNPVKGVKEISIGEKRIYLIAKWLVPIRNHEIKTIVYDGAGKTVSSSKKSFLSKTTSFTTTYIYDINHNIDDPGTWRFEVYLDGNKKIDETLKVVP